MIGLNLFSRIFYGRVNKTDSMPKSGVQGYYRMSDPLSCDKFELHTTQIPDTLNENKLRKNKNYLEIFACKNYGIDIEKYNSLDDLHKCFEEKLQEFADFNFETFMDLKFSSYEEKDACFDKYKKLDMLKDFIEKINKQETSPVKKFIFCSEYLKAANRNEPVLPYDKEVMDTVFEELENNVKSSSIKNTKGNLYNRYKKLLLNSDKLKLSLEMDSKRNEISIKDQYGNEVGSGAFCIEDDVAHYFNLIVREEYRHSKTSKKALNMIYAKREEIARENNVKKLSLDVLISNSRAARGYIKQQNFKVVNFDLSRGIQRMEKQLYDDNISPEIAEKREKETELYYDFCCLDKEQQIHIINAYCYKDDSTLNDTEKAFLQRYTDLKRFYEFL